MAVNKNFVVKNGLEVSTDLIFADASDQHVGLGTTAPLSTLDVRGDVRFADAIGTVNTVEIAGETTINKDLNVGASGTTAKFDVDTGRVGINSAIPRYNLDVRTGAGDTLAASFDNVIFAPNLSITGGGSFATLDVTGITTTGELHVSGVSTVGTAATMYGTFAVSSLTDNRIPVVGAGSTLEDSANLTFDGTDLTVSSAKVSDLTDNRVVIAGTSGALEDDGNLTYDGTRLSIQNGLYVGTAATFSSHIDLDGDLDVDGRTELDITNISQTLNVTGVTTLTNTIAGVVTATSFTGDGSNLTGINAVTGGTIGVALAESFVGAGVTMLDLGSNAGATLTTPSAGVTTFRTLGVSIGLAIALGS